MARSRLQRSAWRRARAGPLRTTSRTTWLRPGDPESASSSQPGLAQSRSISQPSRPQPVQFDRIGSGGPDHPMESWRCSRWFGSSGSTRGRMASSIGLSYSSFLRWRGLLATRTRTPPWGSPIRPTAWKASGASALTFDQRNLHFDASEQVLGEARIRLLRSCYPNCTTSDPQTGTPRSFMTPAEPVSQPVAEESLRVR